MGNIREIRSRMKSVQDIMKITKAMYLISSSKLKKTRKNLAATVPYFDSLQATIHDILLRAPHMRQVYFRRREEIEPEERKKGFLVITADKGLAGAYNHKVIKRAEEEMGKSENNYLYVVGQVGRQYFIRHGIKVDTEFKYTAQNPSLYRSQMISEALIDLFLKGELDDIYIVYSRMVTAVRSEVVFSQILPLERKKFERRKAGFHHIKFEPSPEQVMDYLVPNYLKGFIYGALVESFSSELNARMMAMDAATTSAKDMLRELNLLYNRARQSAITQELTEIVSGAKSLEN